jgi:hypothetical protein
MLQTIYFTSPLYSKNLRPLLKKKDYRGDKNFEIAIFWMILKNVKEFSSGNFGKLQNLNLNSKMQYTM